MRFVLFLLPFAIAASCGGTIAPTSDGGTDAGNDVIPIGLKCNSTADCPAGDECGYPGNGGCKATKRCFPHAPECKTSFISCTCDPVHYAAVSGDCNGAFPQPVTGSACPDCTTGLSCEVCDVTGFSVVPQAKPSQATNACSEQDISSFVMACVDGSATQASCDAWEQSDAGTSACGACVITQSTSATWGPLVCDSSTCNVNTGGCIDVVSGQVAMENGTTGSCGDLTNATNQCIDYACAACTSTSDSTTCSDSAQQNECKSYVDAEHGATACALVDAGTTACSPQTDSDWNAFINVFCGTGP